MTHSIALQCRVIIAAGALAATRAAAAHPPVVDMGPFTATDRWEAVSGVITAAGDDAGPVWRWTPNEGQSAELRLRPDHPLFGALRYYDRLRFRFRVAGGAIDDFGLRALGHVSGARQYKVHQWNLALGATPAGVWHERDVDLTRPNWFPWDNPDGDGPVGFFLLNAMASAPGTVIELADVRLVRSALLVKPFYELPVSWPLKTVNPDGSVTYRLSLRVLNISGRPAVIEARVRSSHTRFRVDLVTNAVAAKASEAVDFPVHATLGRADLAHGAELDSERLLIGFTAASCPEAEATFETRLVRPLSPGLRRQAILPAGDLAALRTLLTTNAELKKRLEYTRVMKSAVDFIRKELRQIPPGHQWPGTPAVPDWVVGDVMPGITNRVTGEQEYGTLRAGTVWKRYMAYPGYAVENLGLAYLFTGDEAYARKALELFRLYAAQYGELPWGRAFEAPWLAGPSIQVSSRMASTSTYGANILMKPHMRLLSMVADSPSWTPADWSRVHTNFAIPYAAELAKAYSAVNNQTDITSHNLVLLGLVFDDALMLHQAVMSDAGLLARIREIDADGFSSEGRPISYHFAGMAEYLPAIEYLANAGLDLPFDHAKLLKAMRMPYRRATLTGWAPNCGDCARGYKAGLQPLAGYLASVFPDEKWLLEIAGRGTLTSTLRAFQAGLTSDPDAWRNLLETDPTLFPTAGFAILRSGANVEDQVMATLDYGRAYLHVGANRQQITLAAFGALFSHDPGSLYNVGIGGMTRINDPQLESFALNHTIGFNVVAVDTQNQGRAGGRLLAWSPRPDFQAAVSRVDGVYRGVNHTRGLILTEGLVIVLDRLEADRERSFDFAYHNLGVLTPGPGWTGAPAAQPLGATANYANIKELRRLSGSGPIRLSWDVTGQFPSNSPLRTAGVALDLWQLPIAGGEVYTGITGLNNPNLKIYPDAAPSLFHRVRAQNVMFATVLEPRKGRPRIAGIDPAPDGGVGVRFGDGRRLVFNLNDLVKHNPPPRDSRQP